MSYVVAEILLILNKFFHHVVASSAMSMRTDSDVSEKIDFMELLPPEVREKLLLLLDHRSLLNCCYVSKRWNELITSHHHVWKKTCLRMSIGKEVLDCDNENWKKLFLQLFNRSRQFETSQCFIEKKLIQTTVDIAAIYYHNGKIATGSEACKVIMIWDSATKEHLRTIQYESSIRSIKFDDNIIIASFYSGEIISWNLMTGFVVDRYYSYDLVLCFDYLTDARVIVAGNENSTISIWKMSSRHPFQLSGYSSSVIDIMIRPYSCKQETGQEIALLLSMDKKEICVKKLSFILDDDASDEVGVEHMFSIPLSPPQLRYGQMHREFPTFGLHFDGEFIYFPDRSNDGRTGGLCVYDFIGKCMSRKIDMLDVVALLGVGKKFAAVIISRGIKNFFSVVDMNTNKEVTRYEVPVFWAEFVYTCVCIGETSFLDGLDGINEKGLVYAAIDNCFTDVFALEWTEKKDEISTSLRWKKMRIYWYTMLILFILSRCLH